MKADNKREKQAQEKVPSSKVTPKSKAYPLKQYAVLNSIEAKECKFSGLRNHNSPKKNFSTLTVQEVIEEALKCSTKMVVNAKPNHVSCTVRESSVRRALSPSFNTSGS